MAEKKQEAQGGFDISALPDVEGVEDGGITFTVRGPSGLPYTYTDADGEERDVTMTVAGSYSKRWRRAEDKIRSRRMKRSSGPTNPQELRADRIRLLSEVTLGWTGFVDKGKPQPCEPEAVANVFRRAPWILEQADAAAGDHEAFFEERSHD